MKKLIPLFIFPLIMLSCTRGGMSDICPEDLKCNNLTNPAGTDGFPDFGWIVSSETRGKTQSAWQVILDKDPKILNMENKVLWNSGKVISDQTSWISCSGPSPEPAQKYYWKVRIWDEETNHPHGVKAQHSLPASLMIKTGAAHSG